MGLKEYSAVLASCALLMACGSKDEESGPAKLATSEYGLVSPFDTLRVAFDQAIQNPNSDDVESDNPFKVVGTEGASLVLAGDSTIAGFAFFKPATEYDVVFNNVKNTDGVGQSEAQTAHFETMPFLDKDYTGCVSTYNDCEYNDWVELADSLMNADGSEFFEGSGLRAGMQSAGILSLNKIKDVAKYKQNDLEDNFLLKLKSGDTVDIKLTGLRQPLDLTFLGPRSKDDAEDFTTYDTTVTNAALDSVVLTHVVGDEHRAGTDKYTDKVDYLIRASFRDANPAGATPYVLSVKVRGYKD